MQNQVLTSAASASGDEIFALSDEQILEIEPGSAVGAQHAAPHLGTTESAEHQSPQADASATDHGTTSTGHGEATTGNRSAATSHESLDPPAWLEAEMKDPWIGDDARELWDGIVQARNEAAAYRAAIATPEDARALKELYPGGVTEARAAAERARTLDEFDRAFFGATGDKPEQLSAARTQLAQQLLQQDPAAFREMVQLGLQILHNAAPPLGARPAVPAVGTLSSDIAANAAASATGPQHAAQLQANSASANSADTHAVAAYAAFERAANDELERSVGGAIAYTIDQALPNLRHAAERGPEKARHAAPLQDRLAMSVRQDVESALKADRQLGEQIAQILATRRFDDATRAQVVRLIGDRAQQLVPSAARRVISEWTQATLAAHRSHSERAENANAKREVAALSASAVHGSVQPSKREILRSADSAQNDRKSAVTGAPRRQTPGATPNRDGRVDYRKLSDEQILDL